MDQKFSPDDIWYALANTEVLLAPQKRLETFGSTVIHYHLLSEKMDGVNEIRVRQGRVHAERPMVLTPAYFERLMLEGFGNQAQEYVEWLRYHVQDLTFLKYGFRFRKEEMQESIIHESFDTAAGRIREHVQAQGDPLSAIIKGVDDAWEICLLKFTTDTIRQSIPEHLRTLQNRKLLDYKNGVSLAVQEEIANDFSAVGSDRTKMKTLGAKLRDYGIFEQYEDQFYDLVRRLS